MGEAYVAQYMCMQGFTILASNYWQPYGEIDLIATKDNLVCFVEVKTRKKKLFSLSSLIVPQKQRKIIKTAQTYILHHNLHNKIIRFDIALVIAKGSDISECIYIPNAFNPVPDEGLW